MFMHVQNVHEHDYLDDSVLGDSMLEEIRRSAASRLRQIEPLIEEAHRLRDVLEVIEGRYVTAEESPPRANGVAVANGAPRAAKGANKRVILDLIGRHPGITAAEIAELTGVKRTVVASTVSRLKRNGELREHEQGGVCLAKAHTAS